MPLTKTIDEIKEAIPNFISNLSDMASAPNMAAAEYKYLVPLIGIDLYNDLVAKRENAGYPENMSVDELQLLKYAQLVAICFAFRDSAVLRYITLTDMA
jgi:hypothetical protein